MRDLNQGLWNRISGRLNARWQTDWAIEDQAKNLNSTARPYDQRAFSPLDPTAIWLWHLALAIYMFVVVNFDVLAQASDFQIERRQVVYLCWMQDLNQLGSLEPNHQHTECPLTNRLSYRSYNNRNPALGVLWSWHRVASPSIEIPIQICFLSGNFDLWSHPSMDHKETTQLVT